MNCRNSAITKKQTRGNQAAGNRIATPAARSSRGLSHFLNNMIIVAIPSIWGTLIISVYE